MEKIRFERKKKIIRFGSLVGRTVEAVGRVLSRLFSISYHRFFFFPFTAPSPLFFTTYIHHTSSRSCVLRPLHHSISNITEEDRDLLRLFLVVCDDA
jgi:hypothetical protein